MKSDMEDETRALTLRIGANAMAIREALGLSCRDAAKLCAAVGYNVGHTFIAKLAGGEHTARRAPKLITIARIVARASAHSALAVFICP